MIERGSSNLEKDKEYTDEEIKEFEEAYEAGVIEVVENLDLFADENGFASLDPASMGIGEQTFHELHPDFLASAKEAMFRSLDVRFEDPNQPEVIVGTYKTQAPEEAQVPGEVDIIVMRTNMGVYLHLMTFEDGVTHWGISTSPEKSV